MKIIDLLNMISKGEEAPKKIKYDNTIYEYDEQYDYKNELQINYYSVIKGEDFFNEVYNYSLNDEVEILKEEKKIPEKISLEIDKFEDSYYDTALIKVASKIDELIDYLDYLKSKGE